MKIRFIDAEGRTVFEANVYSEDVPAIGERVILPLERSLLYTVSNVTRTYEMCTQIFGRTRLSTLTVNVSVAK